ncbi:MAG TPA: hypothetical protein VL424_21610 [Pararobbsia sp.]|nr:hypothetical protein [Pararobbsia sp.]
MTIAFAAALGHAPGITAWPAAADPGQRERLYEGFAEVRRRFEAAEVDELILFTCEHWTNFFLDHVSPFCIGRGSHFKGPVEPWLNVAAAKVTGDPELASQILAAAAHSEVDLSFADELAFDHGTMVPLHFITPAMNVPVVPIFVNTLAPPQPSPRRCARLGAALHDLLANSPKRYGIVATGGMSHDPGERNHGVIDEAFDRRFLELMATGDIERLQALNVDDLHRAGAGAVELLGWIALAGALGSFRGETIAYEPVRPWATGIGLMVLTTDAMGTSTTLPATASAASPMGRVERSQ